MYYISFLEYMLQAPLLVHVPYKYFKNPTIIPFKIFESYYDNYQKFTTIIIVIILEIEKCSWNMS